MVYRSSVQGPENYACEIFTVYLRIFCHKCILPWEVQTSFFRRSTTHVADPLLIKSLNNFRIQVRKNVGSFNKRRLTSTIFPWFLVTKEQNLQWTETTGNAYVWNDLRDITVAVQRLINVEHEWTVAPSMLVSEPRVPQREHKLVSSYMYLLHFLTFCLFYFLYYKGRCVLISDKWPTERSLTYDEASIAIFSVHWLFFKKSFEGNQHIRCSNFLFSINILQRLQTSRAGRSHPWKILTSW